MTPRRSRLCLFLTIHWLLATTMAFGYSTSAHRLINDKVYVVSSMDEYFRGELGFTLDSDGRIANTYPTKQPWQLFEDAGAAEDDAPRWLNHYHDPTQALFYAGLKDSLLGYSNLEWAQFDGLNGYTWKRACDEFLAGLTAADVSVRDQALGNLFSTLGRLTHLLADMASPAHVRDDAHPRFDGYEDWTKNRLTSLDTTIYGKPVYRRYEIPPDNAIYTLSLAYPSRLGTDPYSPASNLWDTNPTATDNVMTEWTRLVQNPTTVGLAEYSSYNYLSDDTVFTDYFYPSREEVGVSLVPRTAKDGQTDYVLYFKRTASDGILVQHLAATDLVFLDQQTPLDNSFRYVAAHLDPNCYEDYASNLVPRAVSYGTALVDYFFRGKFDVTSDGSTLTVTNLSRGTVDGSFTIYADDAAGIRTAVPNFVDLPLRMLGVDNTITLSGFNPSGSRNDQYTLVFRGTMQNTGSGGASNWDDVVAGKVFLRTPSTLPDKITVGANPHGLALSPDGRKLYVTNTASNTVSVIDTATRSVTATIAVGAGPVDVAVSPDSSRAFVSNELGRSVSVINSAGNSVIATISNLAPWPEELAATADGRFVYLAHWSWTPLTVIDTNSLQGQPYTTPLRPCQGVAFHPSDNTAYLTYYTFFWRNAVGVVNRNDRSLVAAIPGADLNWSVAIAGPNRALYVANPQLNTVSVFDTAANQPSATITVGRSPRGVAASLDGSRVYVANLYDDTVSVIDTSSNAVINTMQAGDGAFDVAVSLDGRLLYVSNAFEGTVSVIPATGGAAAPATFAAAAMTAASPEEATWGTIVLAGFPSGGRVFVDGEFPRWEGAVDGGMAVSFPAGTRTLHMACPGYVERAFPVSAGAGETVTVDGQLQPEP